jgi:hypothetical protein
MTAGNDVGLVLKVQGILALIRGMTGESASAVYSEDHVDIVLTPAQQQRVGRVFANMMSGAPGRIRIDVLPIITPPLVQKFGLIAAAVLGAAYIAGRLSKD